METASPVDLRNLKQNRLSLLDLKNVRLLVLKLTLVELTAELNSPAAKSAGLQ